MCAPLNFRAQKAFSPAKDMATFFGFHSHSQILHQSFTIFSVLNLPVNSEKDPGEKNHLNHFHFSGLSSAQRDLNQETKLRHFA